LPRFGPRKKNHCSQEPRGIFLNDWLFSKPPCSPKSGEPKEIFYAICIYKSSVWRPEFTDRLGPYCVYLHGTTSEFCSTLKLDFRLFWMKIQNIWTCFTCRILGNKSMASITKDAAMTILRKQIVRINCQMDKKVIFSMIFAFSGYHIVEKYIYILIKCSNLKNLFSKMSWHVYSLY